MLSRLIYKSRSLCTPAEARNICSHASQTNSAMSVTGALCLLNGDFLQYLEGDELVLSALYSVIQRDSRHTTCEVLDSRLISSRVFRGWGMAWLPIGEDTALLIEALLPGNLGLASLDGASAGAMFVALSRAAGRQ